MQEVGGSIPPSSTKSERWAISSVGRAPPLQGGGHWFEPGIAHHFLDRESAIVGAIAQLGERLPCTQEVSSSILLSSTISLYVFTAVISCCDDWCLKANNKVVYLVINDMLFNNLES